MNVSGFVVASQRDHTPYAAPYHLPHASREGGGKFEHFLSGDEYYWLHQNQLQPSALCFETNKCFFTHKSSIASSMLQKKQEHRTDMPKTSMPLQQESWTPSYAVTTKTTEREYNQPLTQYIENVSLNPTRCLYECHNNQTTNTQKRPTFILKPLRQNVVNPTYRKHHVFLDKNEAELSINLRHASKQEQTKLIQWIKNILKEKKLMLKQLMINGVFQ